jgi:hypothetical protein
VGVGLGLLGSVERGSSPCRGAPFAEASEGPDPRVSEPEASKRGPERTADARAPAEPQPPAPRELHWTFEKGPFGATDVVVSLPERADAARRFPVLVAFHGRGESVKGRKRGARGWLDDYALTRALERVQHPPLSREDFEGFVGMERLQRLNAGLNARPYEGLIVVCPFLPDVLKGAKAFREAEPLAQFVVDVLLPRVYAKTPAIGTAATTGIDGVSLGGRAALLVGLSRPLAFHSVSGLQAALDEKELARLSDWAVQALQQNPGLALRLLTSDEDYFREVNQQFSRRLTAKGVRHELTQVIGTHSYRFNRGPAAFEMLLYQDRVLRGVPSL